MRRSTRNGVATCSSSIACSGQSRARSRAGDSPDALIEAFVAHNEEVKRIVPAERLLVWEVSEGWEPLCEFLGRPRAGGAAAARERPRDVPGPGDRRCDHDARRVGRAAAERDA